MNVGDRAWLINIEKPEWNGAEVIIANPLPGIEMPGGMDEVGNKDDWIYCVTLDPLPGYEAGIACWVEPDKLTSTPPSSISKGEGRP